MFFLWFLTCVCIGSVCAQQSYDGTLCSSDANYPGTRYTCNSLQKSCQTFLVYRANEQFQTVSDISSLFSMDPDELLTLNNVTSSQILKPGREVLVPINCSCSDKFFRANFSFIVPLGSTTFTEIACGVFEGLVKSVTLADENLPLQNNLNVGSMLHVPLRCACPDDNFSSSSGVKYLVTYPFVEGDDTDKISKKFSIPLDDLWEANHLDPNPTVYPNTTVLVPLKGEPVLNFNIPDIQPPTPGFLPTRSVEQGTKPKQLEKLYIAGSVIGFSLLLVTLLALGLYVKALNKWKAEHFQSSMARNSLTPCSSPRSSQLSGPTPRSSTTNSCLSPDLLVGIKYSLCNYSAEELRRATKDFSQDAQIIDYVYKGLLENIEVMIKQMRFEDTRQIIDVHSKINHVNIVKLLGVSYGENDFSWSYLVFEFPTNGCLRDYLSSSSNPLRWRQRTQIAFDMAMGIHYLHYCMVPPYIHMRINSRNIFLMSNWRAKLAVFESISAVGSSKEIETMSNIGGWVAPEHLLNGLASEKADIFAFGVVMLELISGKEDLDGKLFKESIGFLGGSATEGGCFEQLKIFLDPRLKDDYPLAEALCLAVLAKACVEDDPMHRPSMDDIIKVLARMV
ncbi:unnamed protein product [Ilex paraguariensis]|uniref:Uncharacterized protein n=1 Tax=Ilex paraguariensis TaxID=185542 RepID=A0ABC8T7U7_9AQUA